MPISELSLVFLKFPQQIVVVLLFTYLIRLFTICYTWPTFENIDYYVENSIFVDVFCKNFRPRQLFLDCSLVFSKFPQQIVNVFLFTYLFRLFNICYIWTFRENIDYCFKKTRFCDLKAKISKFSMKNYHILKKWYFSINFYNFQPHPVVNNLHK